MAANKCSLKNQFVNTFGQAKAKNNSFAGIRIHFENIFSSRKSEGILIGDHPQAFANAERANFTFTAQLTNNA